MSHQYKIREEEQIRTDLSAYLKRHELKQMLRFLVAGSVDDGKSTLIGRLLYDSRLIYEDQLNAISMDSRTYNTTRKDIDLALLTDGLKAEREQGITIDVAYRYFSTEKRSFIICDAPGHEQYTRNMATGASHCDLALILVDATLGVKDQTRRHSLIASLMGIRRIVVLVNKMDLTGYDRARFSDICADYEATADKLGIEKPWFVPISALEGDNVVEPGTNMPWYTGKPLLSLLEEIPLAEEQDAQGFRFPVQLAIRPDSLFRGFAGTVASGSIRKGDAIRVLPSGAQTRIKSIETFDGPLEEAFAGQPVVLTTTEEVDISRGCMLVRPDEQPMHTNRLEAMLVWMDDTAALTAGNSYLLKSHTQTVPVTVREIRYQYDLNKLEHVGTDTLNFNGIGLVEIVGSRALLFDPFMHGRKTGSFILIDRMTNQTCAAGIIPQQESVAEQPLSADGNKPVPTLWFTGLSGSGKSTIARALKEELDRRGVPSYILDGDELRTGLNSNLGFSPEDRKENVRRTAEVARILNRAGIISIAAMISPYKADRADVARIIGDNFVEVFIDTDIETCKARDPKGLYEKVAQGAIRGFTGIDAPYEKPDDPHIAIRTTDLSVQQAVERLVSFILKLSRP